ncbi:MAG: ammonium transporter, partial [Salinivirgaceae bacterium]|nr:ammonium transporter [Salinivirgaceae bacterium]
MKKIYLLFLGLLAFTFQTFAGETAAIDTGATAWMLTSTALVLLMVPGLAMFYGGLVRSKNVLGTMMHSFVAMGVMSVLWVAVGYSMSFGKNVLGGWFGWNPDYFFLSGIDETITAGGIPEYVFSMFQGKFAIITPALIAGAFAERVSFKGYILFIAIWGIFIYNPLCHWVWAEDGFLFNLGPKGAIDFAGGTVVHISAGISGLVAAIYLGTRRGYPHRQRRPNNLVMTLMGAGLLWVGWFGFNAGSSLSSGLVTAQALTATQAAAAAGAISWILIESLHVGKTTALGFVSGILAGLVAVTPAAGVVQPIGAMALGVIASIICYMAIILKDKLGYDDSLDAFGIHGVGGIVGALLLSFFIRASWMADAATLSEGGWTALQQFGIQATAVGIAIAYAVVGT